MQRQVEAYDPDVSRETTDLLLRYAELIQKWTRQINLVAPSQTNDLWNRHILDSYQLIKYVPEATSSVTDLGSGGGLPGLVLAIHAKVHNPDRKCTLIESDQRKSVFLRTVIRELGLNARVISERIEKAEVEPADVVTARALASLDDLLAMANPLLRDGGLAIFPKGKSAAQELEIARTKWRFTCQEIQSLTNLDARILVIRDMKRAAF